MNISGLNKALAGICAFLFVITGVSALYLFNFEQKAFSSETYKQVFAEQELYKNVPSMVADMAGTFLGESDGSFSLLGLLNRDQLVVVISTLLPPDQLNALTDQTLDSTFDYLNGKTDSVSVSLLPIKQNLMGDAGMQAFQNVLAAQPACTTEQLFQMGLGLFSDSNQGLILCNPPQEALTLVTPMVKTQLQALASALPDQVTLVAATDSNSTINELRTSLKAIRTLSLFFIIAPFFFLLLLTFFVVRSFKDWMLWWGVPFAITGALGTVTAFASAPITRWLMSYFISKSNFQLPAAITPIFLNIADALTSQITQPIMLESLILLFVGAVMFGIGLIPTGSRTHKYK